MNSFSQRYLIARLDEYDFRPLPDAEFEVQILNADGQGEIVAYLAQNSNKVIALVHALRGNLPVESHGIPEAVIEAAQRKTEGFGDYVNEKGEIIQPSFYPPTT
jgi:hypothetical protein